MCITASEFCINLSMEKTNLSLSKCVPQRFIENQFNLNSYLFSRVYVQYNNIE